jgi:Spy/CpxP family protein refolding chaperone
MITSHDTTHPETISAKGRRTKRRTMAAVLAAAAIAVTVPFTYAHQGGYGPGMMGGYGGYGGYGMGPGMMGGYGGYGGYGMGPGMMGGYGGYGGFGMGPGMMGGYGGYGGYGMGHGMMYGYGGYAAGALDLTDDQREKMTKIQESLSTKRWELMGKLQEQQFQLREQLASGKGDDAAVGKAYRNIEGLRQQIWTAGADAQKQMDAVLTKSQREQLQRGWGRGAD